MTGSRPRPGTRIPDKNVLSAKGCPGKNRKEACPTPFPLRPNNRTNAPSAADRAETRPGRNRTNGFLTECPCLTEELVDFLGRYKEVLAAVAFIAFSAALFFSTGSIRVFAPNSASYINAQFFPYLLSSLLGLVSVVQLIIAIRKLPASVAAKGGMSRGGMGRIFLTLVLLAVYVGLLKDVGFLIMTACYVFFQSLLLTPGDRISVTFSLGLALVSSSVIYFLFTQILSLMLPRAPFMPF